MPQDVTAERSRLMRDGKRGGVLVSNFEQTQDQSNYTYNGDGTVSTIVVTKVQPDGATWRKTIVFGYTAGLVVSRSEVIDILP